jgi:hypothetical protein
MIMFLKVISLLLRMRQNVIELLKGYTGKNNVYLTQRGNKSILYALKMAKSLSKRKVLIQDQGGWITYLQYPEKLKMELVKIKTDLGIMDANELSKKCNSDTVLLVNSLSGYFAEQPIGLLNAICKQKNAMMINDASGSIGTESAKFGDIIIGSFGDKKPIDIDYGGFIAFDNSLGVDKSILEGTIFDDSKLNSLLLNLENLPKRLRFLEKHTTKIKNDLSQMKIIHPDLRGINVVVAFKDKFERERIINYCNEQNYEYTECPRYIRVNVDAISIEVKRLKG